MNKTEYRSIVFPIPPFSEQLRISTKIDELFSFLDAGTVSLRKVQAQLKRYRQAVLKYAFEGKLTEEWRKTHRELKDSSETFSGSLNLNELSTLPSLPESWKWFRVENIGEVSGGLAKNSHRGECSHNMPYLRVANVYAGHLWLGEIKYIGVNANEIDKLLLKVGDLLVVEGNGSIDQIGRVAVWGGQILPCIHQNHIIKIRFSDPTDSMYALYWLLSPDGREHIKKVASSTSGLHTLSISKIKRLPIPFSTKNERKKIVSEIEQKLSVLENVEQNLPSLIALTNRLRQSILKQAFEGQLVPQNPSDESAERLLEREKAEHFNNKKPKSDDQLELPRYVK
jgi:type I restriction enzyme, S subunit